MIFFRFLSQCIFALALLQPVIALDTVNSGNYLIHLCDSDLPNSYASKLQKLLPQVYNGLQKVIADLQLGTASTHGYSTFFKNDSSKAEVLQVYQSMAAGANVALGNVIRRPTLLCAGNVRQTNLLYQYCVGGDSALLTWPNTELMPVCPIFWTIPTKVNSSDCPLVSLNRLAVSDHQLFENQEALVVGNLVHFYHAVSSNYTTNIADVGELSASESLTNPTIYALYYAAVQAGCVDFPAAEDPISDQPLRALLGVDPDSSNPDIGPPLYSGIPLSAQVPPDLSTLQNFCNPAVYAPNQTVCCDENTGLWQPAPVIRDGRPAHSIDASCPQPTGGTGGPGAGSGRILWGRRGMSKA